MNMTWNDLREWIDGLPEDQMSMDIFVRDIQSDKSFPVTDAFIKVWSDKGILNCHLPFLAINEEENNVLSEHDQKILHDLGKMLDKRE